MNKPKIGIRVIVDGRCNGVREKIEGPTYVLARLAKALIEENIKYASGEPVECVISSVAVGGAEEAARISDEFRHENVGAILSVSRAFAYASEIMEYDTRIPQAIWGFNGSERPGAVYLAAATAVAEQKGTPVFKIYGKDVQDADDLSIPEDVREKILLFARCSVAMMSMKGHSYLSIGGTCMGIGASIADHEFFRCYLGMQVETVDMCEIIRRLQLGIYDYNEYEHALEWTRKHCEEMNDPNPLECQQSREEKDEVWKTIVKMTIIIRDLMTGNPVLKDIGFQEESLGHHAIAAGFQGQRKWTDFMPNGDFSESVLGSSFDWNGARRPYIVSTENDSLNAVTMLMGNLLTGTAQIFADVRAYWSPKALEKMDKGLSESAKDGFIYLTNSGAAALDGTMASSVQGTYGIKPFWDMDDEDIKNCLRETKWGAGKLATFRGGGFSASFLSRGGVPLTMVRLSLIKGVGPVLQVAEGTSIQLNAGLEEAVIGRTDPTWPKTFFVPRLTSKGAFKSVYDLMNQWGTNHCSLCYGHVGPQFITLASMLRIPVCTHNVEEERIFRPAAWNMTGGMDIGSDFRACGIYGPIYAKY